MNAKSIIDGCDEDVVNHPKHYENCSLECIEMMEIVFGSMAVINFCLCNAFKYIWGYKNKSGIVDLDKAKWYLNKVIEMDKKYVFLNSVYIGMCENMIKYCDKVLEEYNGKSNEN